MSDQTPPEPDSPLVIVPPPLSVLPRSKSRARAWSKAQSQRLQSTTSQAPRGEPPIAEDTPSSVPLDRGPSQAGSITHSVQSTGPSTSTSQHPLVTPPDISILSEATAPAIAAIGSTAPTTSTVESKPIAFSESLAEKLGAYAGQPTGIQQMAAAAKRGQAGLAISNSVKGKEDEDHPLSDKCLKERDYHTILAQRHLFHLPSRFNFVRPLGSGAYGVVILARVEDSDVEVAIKCVTRVFDQVILAKRALREITLLKHFQSLEGHKNVSGLVDLDNVWEGYNEIYFYLEPLQTDLHHVIHKSRVPLTPTHIQYIFYQILRGMKYVHSAHVIHRDLKPGNILLNEDCEVRICDFGLARGYKPVSGEEDQNQGLLLTEHVATKWYRAPEVLLHHRRYTTAIDVWSMGCILGELLGSKTLFPGDNALDQLKLILGLLGTPTEEVLNKVANAKSAELVNSLPLYPPKPLTTILPRATPSALDLMSQLLNFDPFTRIAVPQAIEHPWLADFHVATDEPDCPEVFSQWEEVEQLDTLDAIREAITREINEFRDIVRSQALEEEEELLEEGIEDLADEFPFEADSPIVPASALLDPDISPRTTINPSHISQRPEIDATGMSGALAASQSDPTLDTPFTVPGPRRRLTSSQTLPRNYVPGQPLSHLDSNGLPCASPTDSPSSSRKSSFNRRPKSSFLFGGGMTALSPVARPSTIYAEDGGSMRAVSGYARRPTKSRTPSLAAGDFGALRPIIRGISAVNLQDLRGKGDDGEEGVGEGKDGLMLVSPSDAPPSTRPMV